MAKIVVGSVSSDDLSKRCDIYREEDSHRYWPKTQIQFRTIVDRFTSLKDVTDEIRKEGLEACGLIFAIDYTASNATQGCKTFGGHSLHDMAKGKLNPYQQVIAFLGETLESFDDDSIIPAYGFGDAVTRDRDVFPLNRQGDCRGFMQVLNVYRDITPTIQLSGPTSFAPAIEKAIEHVKQRKQYHILIIVADGQVTKEEETIDAIVKASEYPLSIVVIGVGDGPWDILTEFDDLLPQRQFDNFQFVDFHKITSQAKNKEAAFALWALMEIPDQYKFIRNQGILERI